MQFTLTAAASLVLALASLASSAAVAAPDAPLEARAPKGKCPPIYPHSPTTFLPDDKDCNVFYICDYPGPVRFNCPAGLHFSPTTWVCDYPANAGCRK